MLALVGKGVLEGKANEIIDACKTYNINPLYFIAHTFSESGNGSSKLAKGITITEYYDKSADKMVSIPATKVYNLFGIGAIDSSPIVGGTSYAYRNGWTSIDATIKGSAKFLAEKYLHSSQNTLYEMRFNPKGYEHQYASDPEWATTIAEIMYENAYIINQSTDGILEIATYK